MIYPRLERVTNGQRLSVELVNGLIKRTEYAADLLRQYKCLSGTDSIEGTNVSVARRYDGTTISGEGGDFKIVGNYRIGGVQRGFIYDGSTYTDIMVPGSSLTQAYGIDGSNIVGTYVRGGIQTGYLFNGSTFTDIIVPFANSSLTQAFGIDGNNIVGRYNFNLVVRGFLYNGTTYTSLLGPGLDLVTVANDVDGNNIVGIYNQQRSFLYNGISYTDIMYPGALTTFARGIDKTNIVGRYVTSGAESRGFIYDGSTFSDIVVPGSTSTEATRILGNNIVGF